jgi:hypothetical protein
MTDDWPQKWRLSSAHSEDRCAHGELFTVYCVHCATLWAVLLAKAEADLKAEGAILG